MSKKRDWSYVGYYGWLGLGILLFLVLPVVGLAKVFHDFTAAGTK